MTQWLRRARGAIGMGVVWAAVWAPVAVVIGTRIIDPDNSMDEMWVMVGAIPGFLSGVLFSAVLGFAARTRRLEELSLGRVAGWGALAGLGIGILPFLIGDVADGVSAWRLAAIVIPTFTLLAAASAAGSLLLARRALRGETADEVALIDAQRMSTAALPDGTNLPPIARAYEREAGAIAREERT